MRRELAFTAYNRVDYLQETVASWNTARNLSNWNAYFYIEPSPVVTHVTNAANQLETTTVAYFNQEKLGVLVNPWNALNNRFDNGADFVVLAEDDVVVSSDAIEFLDWAAQKYVNEPDVLAVNLFSQVGGEKENEVTKDGKFSPLVWGTWKDRWQTYLKDTWDKNYSSGNLDGSEAGWDWNINRILSSTKMNIIKPLQSRSDHIGKYAGTHMTPDLYDSSRGVEFTQTRGRQNYIEIS